MYRSRSSFAISLGISTKILAPFNIACNSFKYYIFSSQLGFQFLVIWWIFLPSCPIFNNLVPDSSPWFYGMLPWPTQWFLICFSYLCIYESFKHSTFNYIYITWIGSVSNPLLKNISGHGIRWKVWIITLIYLWIK